MKEELTRAVIEALAKCSGAEYSKCENCPATKICGYTDGDIFKWLATALLEEMDKPKVFECVPDNVMSAQVSWYQGCIFKRKKYTRKLPKTLIDNIVEEVIDGRLFGLRMEKSELTEILKSALEKYAAELKGEA